jgi:TDG/mug DNA glycosylase family protein
VRASDREIQPVERSTKALGSDDPGAFFDRSRVPDRGGNTGGMIATMSYAESFPPILGPHPRVLILGSLPGAESLARREYYAKPQNAFWRIMGDLVGAVPALAYQARRERLAEAGVALWDVCRAAYRAGSLDSAIRDPEPNDISGLLATHPTIRLIGFNGRFAETLFTRVIRPMMDPTIRGIATVLLPSTSPAHAGMPYPAKLERWRQALAGAITSLPDDASAPS